MVSVGFFPNGVKHLCGDTHLGSLLTEETEKHLHKYLIYDKSVDICQLQRQTRFSISLITTEVVQYNDIETEFLQLLVHNLHDD